MYISNCFETNIETSACMPLLILPTGPSPQHFNGKVCYPGNLTIRGTQTHLSSFLC